jgi:hypothetical protein
MRAIRSGVGGRSQIKESVKPEQKKALIKKADATVACVSLEECFLTMSEKEVSPSPMLRTPLRMATNVA